MSVDLATLGIKVDASEADSSAISLNKLADAGGKAEASIGRLKTAASNGLGTTANAANDAVEKMRSAAAASSTLEDRLHNLLAETFPLAKAQGQVNLMLAEANALYKQGALSAELYSGVTATLGNRAEDLATKQAKLTRQIASGGDEAKMAASKLNGLAMNLTQLASGDVSPMNLLQIFTDISSGADGASFSVGSMAKNIGMAIKPVAGPLLIIAAIVGGLALDFDKANDRMDKSLGDIAKNMNLTAEQMERLKDKGTDTTITLADRFFGFGDTVKDVFLDAFEPQLDSLTSSFNSWYDNLNVKTWDTIDRILGAFVGGYNGIIATWSMLPSAIGNLAVSAANSVINTVEKMVNDSIAAINILTSMLPMGLGADMKMSGVSLDRMKGGGNTFSDVGDTFSKEFNNGKGSVTAARGRFSERWDKNTQERAEERIGEDAGDPNKASRGRKGREGGKSEGENAADKQEDYLKSLQEETTQIGKNRVELKMMEIAKAAALSPKFKTQIEEAGKAWKSANDAQATKEFVEAMKKENDETAFNNTLVGMNNEQKAEAQARRQIEIALLDQETNGITLLNSAIIEETQRKIELAKVEGRFKDIGQAANDNADNMSRLADNVRDSTDAFADLFGRAGEGFRDLTGILTDYYEMQFDNEARLAQYKEGTPDYIREQKRQTEQAAEFELDTYGRLIGGVKSMFSEKSTVYKALQAAEKAYAIFRTAMAIKEIAVEIMKTTAAVGGAGARMAVDTAETGTSVANSGLRATADGIAAFAKTVASLPFPLNIVAGAAVLAALVAVGVKISGGGGGKAGKGKATDEIKQPTYKGSVDEYGNPTSSYSVLKPGRTTVGSNDNSPARGGVNVGDTHITIQGNTDERTVIQLQEVLKMHRQETVQEARQAAVADRITAASRQRIGGG